MCCNIHIGSSFGGKRFDCNKKCEKVINPKGNIKKKKKDLKKKKKDLKKKEKDFKKSEKSSN